MSNSCRRGHVQDLNVSTFCVFLDLHKKYDIIFVINTLIHEYFIYIFTVLLPFHFHDNDKI